MHSHAFARFPGFIGSEDQRVLHPGKRSWSWGIGTQMLLECIELHWPRKGQAYLTGWGDSLSSIWWRDLQQARSTQPVDQGASYS